MSVILYQHIDFRGAHKHVINRNEQNLHQDEWGDKVSSIQILSGLWRFYQHVNYGGQTVLLGPGNYRWVEDVNIDNDSLSSLRCVWGGGLVRTPGLVIYQHIDFTGDHKHIIDRNEPNLHVDGWGDRISSFHVISDRWQFCQHVTFAGGWKKICEPGNYRWIEQVGISNDSLSSIRQWQPLQIVDAMPTVETILYQHIHYGGDHKHLINRGQKNLHTDNWGDKVSSLQVLSGTRWMFYQHANYGGSSISLGPGNYPWIVNAGMANDMLSSVRAHIVPVFCKTIQGSTPNIARDMNTANQIFNPHDIDFFQLGQDTNNVPALLDLDQPTCFSGQTPTAEENNLYNLERDHAPADIIAYYVRSTNIGVRGCAAHPSGQPGSVVTDVATQYTMAHEIGHVLGLGHVTDRSNLMHPNTGQINVHPPNLTNTQLNTIRGSKYLV
jgi:hypothetical protein